MATISSGSFSARSRARRDLPLAVGPSRTKAPANLAAARDVEQRPRGVRRLVREQPEDGARDLLGLAVAAERRGGADPSQPRRVAARGMDLGIDDTGPDRVDADAFTAELL